jgi:hypothetical protein
MKETNGFNNPAKLTYTTKCKLQKNGGPCGFPIIDHPMNVEIVGQPDARVQRFIGVLMSHLQKSHKEAWITMQATSQQFFGWLALTAFDSPDPNIQGAQKFVANSLRRMLCGPMVTDGEIESFVGALPLTMEDPNRQHVLNAIRHMRDYYEGNLSQQPAEQKTSSLITP